MAIIVESKTNKKRYVLLGTGLGMYKSSRPSFLGGTLLPTEEKVVSHSIVLCDEAGEIIFVDRSSFRVIEVDGMNLDDLKSKLKVNESYIDNEMYGMIKDVIK